jgi:hypothetical protein
MIMNMIMIIHFSNKDSLRILFLLALWDATGKKLKGQYHGECEAIWKSLPRWS